MSVELLIGNKNYSSWSLRAWLLLSESRIEFREVKLPLDTPEFAQRIGEWSPAGCVPVLKIDGELIWDTLAIAETVAERWPDKLLWPDDPRERAFARSIAAEMHAGFSTLRGALPMNCRAMGRQVKSTAALDKDITRILSIWTDCRIRYAANGPWLLGRFSIVDAMYAPVAMRFRSYGIVLPDPAREYPQRLLESTAMQNWLRDAAAEVQVLEHEEVGL